MNLVNTYRNHMGGRTVSRLSLPRRLAPIAAALAVVTLAACKSDPTPSPSPSVTASASSAASSPSASASDPATAAMAAYRGMWRSFVDASDVADPDQPALAQYATDSALTKLRNGVQDLKTKGLINTGDVTLLAPKVTAVSTSVKPIQVQISDCVDTSATHLVKRDGSAYNDTPGGRRAMQAQVTQQPDGGWKVSGFALREVGSC